MSRDAGPVAAATRRALEPRRDEMVDLLRTLVEVESPSDDGAALAGMAQLLEERFADYGTIERYGTHRLLRVDG